MIFRTVTGHEQKQQYNDEIANVKILRKKLPQEVAYASRGRFLGTVRWLWRMVFLAGRRTFRLRRTWWRFLFSRLRTALVWNGSAVVGHPAAAVRAIGLWDVAVIHDIT